METHEVNVRLGMSRRIARNDFFWRDDGVMYKIIGSRKLSCFY